jgi:hypothetical protein
MNKERVQKLLLQMKQKIVLEEYITLFQDRLCLNSKSVEDGLQIAIHGHPLGMRLHRKIAKGRQMDNNDGNIVFTVFLTYFKADSYNKDQYDG